MSSTSRALRTARRTPRPGPTASIFLAWVRALVGIDAASRLWQGYSEARPAPALAADASGPLVDPKGASPPAGGDGDARWSQGLRSRVVPLDEARAPAAQRDPLVERGGAHNDLLQEPPGGSRARLAHAERAAARRSGPRAVSRGGNPLETDGGGDVLAKGDAHPESPRTTTSPASLSDPAALGRRRHPRVRVELATEVRPAAGLGRKVVVIPGRLVDVSVGGARIEIQRWLSPGEWVTVAIPRAAERLSGDLLRGIPVAEVSARVVTEAVPASEGRYSMGLAFATSFPARIARRLNEGVSWLALAALIGALVPVVRLKEVNVTLFWIHPLANAYGLLVTAYILSRLVLALLYRPPRDSGHRPSVTVIVACKNEEASIRRTLECVYGSDYPADLLEVIAVDDGSTDGTLAEMQRTALAHPSLKIISFAKNRGKRHAMAEGARIAHGEVLVYVDSDSFLRPQAILKLASTFADPRVAAVSGHADVQNARTNFLTKMQEVRYYLAFRVVKAAESVFSAVTCCSGCLAAYRRSCVMEVLDRWLDQRFLGVPATFGDDRSLTRIMLKRYRVLYHSEAECTTIVPDDWKVFFRQQLRWKKSWIRENWLLSAFMWKRHPVMAVSFYMSVAFPLVSPGIVIHAIALPLVGIGTFSFVYVYGAVLMGGLYALVYLARHRNWLWLYGIWFSLFYMVALVWQTYYALVTVRQNQWGTR